MTREEAIELLVNATYSEEWQGNEKLTKAQHMAIEALVQEPIIHCKDCKYWQDNNNGYPVMDCRWDNDETPDADDYCSFAERRAEQ